MFAADGHIKLVDFGFAKKGTKFSSFCGTPEYIAPEIIMEMPYTKSTDFWALGILIFEMITGNSPYSDPNSYKIYKNTLENPIKCPGSFSNELKSLI